MSGPFFPGHRPLPRVAARRHRLPLILVAVALTLFAGCKKAAGPPALGAPEVTVMTVTAQDTPVQLEFTAQTQSSREVEIRARVDGFLDRRTYSEGDKVKAGQTMFLMDPKPFQAALQTARGELAQQQARLTVAQQNLARVKPLAAQQALSQKDLDDAVGNEKQAQAAVISAQGQVETAELNLGYTTIKSPLDGLASYARQQDGSYLIANSSGLLTFVYQLDPIWVNFSISENEMLHFQDEIAAGKLIFPPNSEFVVAVILADGTEFPQHGTISFANPAFSTDTGTFLVRATLANPKGTLRPGQFVRARVSGATRPNAILVPQRAVLQGARSHFVWVVDNESKARQRVVEVGDWSGDNWFINDGLKSGERIVVDGAIRVVPDVPLKIAGTLPSTQTGGKAIVEKGGASAPQVSGGERATVPAKTGGASQ
ncbi:efflux RND transporter periplasmic adaptor subunit [Paraburkholderia silvatlantica]|uniref:Membrane fusion protein (Multidrug efflux system) n=1 Tax=Paraburkholderia silvatlantica TaxID=321895 RepID=A0A2U1AC22_9BURK|nr:efflux RND transporter periplasmic adaptor subunit [Paraburkholderia silvatlantica]MBB2925756.1 membrane fusion protein (multidrug efflux system) [Paraburkholderia silvatlantica]PVY33128.1 membrane fusion protein (multidrug efflux system) [Paraburkholderia silvatlantica]PXW38020.1 membrane fusion protein (multidrug efflux system) [Paraburkholderia silvatlantica]PYE27957.1 membrane fusion protein (multidrug efflux system) [Paraburkholderia silvatlantica]TDQ92549.1 membrane fusion protein (mu